MEEILAGTPTWAVATVLVLMLTFGSLFSGSLKRFGKWLKRTKRQSLFAALEKIKEELMLFGVLSLLMGHWTVFVAKICVNTSVMSKRFYPCPRISNTSYIGYVFVSRGGYSNKTVITEKLMKPSRQYCPEGKESFASYESLEQLHRFLFVLGVIHVTYTFIAIVLAMTKIHSWKTWENEAKLMAVEGLEGSPESISRNTKLRRLSTFILNRTSHPWSQHRVLVWLLCFSRQFWSSINRADYMALRLGFITTHELPLSYDFHKYMLRSMQDEFREIVGISVPLWIYAILCIFLDFHGTNAYFWLSFLPAILVLLIGTKLHRVVVKLAVEIMDRCPWKGYHQFNLRDELFWFGKPWLLLKLIQFISFQNAIEMATVLWSLWEIKDPSCFTENNSFLVIRLTFGVVSQCWCSFITFPLCVIITQMGSRLKKSVLSENVRLSLHGWQKRVKAKRRSSLLSTTASVTSLDSMVDDETQDASQRTVERGSSRLDDASIHHQSLFLISAASVTSLDSMVDEIEIDEIQDSSFHAVQSSSSRMEDLSIIQQNLSLASVASFTSLNSLNEIHDAPSHARGGSSLSLEYTSIIHQNLSLRTESVESLDSTIGEMDPTHDTPHSTEGGSSRLEDALLIQQGLLLVTAASVTSLDSMKEVHDAPSQTRGGSSPSLEDESIIHQNLSLRTSTSVNSLDSTMKEMDPTHDTPSHSIERGSSRLEDLSIIQQNLLLASATSDSNEIHDASSHTRGRTSSSLEDPSIIHENLLFGTTTSINSLNSDYKGDRSNS